MALARLNSRVLAQAQKRAKARRRLLSSRHLQPSFHCMRPSKLALSPAMPTHNSAPRSFIRPNEPRAMGLTLSKSKTTPEVKPKPADDHEDSTSPSEAHRASLADHHQAASSEHQPSSAKHHPPDDAAPGLSETYYDSLGASVQRLQIPHVPISTSDGAATDELAPCKSSAKRKLDELLRDPIHFVPATKATMNSEPAPKRRRVQPQEQVRKNRAIAHVTPECSRPDLGATGFLNDSGVLCYRRSSLQVLMNLPIFVNWIKLHGTSDRYRCPKPNCLACALRELVNVYWPAPDERRSTHRVNRAVENFDKVINKLPGCPGGAGSQKYRQQDAQEFLMFTINKLSDYMPDNELKALFGLKRYPWRVCRNCGHQERGEPGDDMGATVNLRHPQRRLSFKTYFDQFFYEEIPPTCEKCSKKKHDRKHVVLGGPEVMLITLVRFDCNNVGRAVKVNDPVQFPLYLDLSEYLDSGKMQRPGTLRYGLTSVLQHSGAVSGGHYTAKVVSPLGIQNTNDIVVGQPQAIKELLKPTDQGFTPYVLAYLKLQVVS